MTKITKSYAQFTTTDVNNTTKVEGENFIIDDRMLDAVFKGLIEGLYGYPSSSAAVNPLFNRYSGKLRSRVVGMTNNYNLCNALPSSFNNIWQGEATTVIDYQMSRVIKERTGIITTDVPIAVGSISAGTNTINGVPSSGGAPANTPHLPEYTYGLMALSHVDIPNTRIGTVFPHPIGRNGLFNEVGQIAAGVGTMATQGKFYPTEDMLDHYSYRVYITKSGGIGRIGDPLNTDLASRINGTVGAIATNGQITDASAPFVGGIHDTGLHYIRVESGSQQGTHLITSVLSATTVQTDGIFGIIETALNWEMVTGPIAEYFIQRRPYSHGDLWSSQPTTIYSSNLPLTAMAEQVGKSAELISGCSRMTPDGTGHFWWAKRKDSGALTLGRWLNMSTNTEEAIYQQNNISGMPLGITKFSDVMLDSQGKLWVSWVSEDAADGSCLARIDPAPAGSTATPSVLTLFSKAGAMLTNKPTWITTESGGRVWISFDTDTAGSKAGHMYTDDFGVTWSSVRELSATTGTSTVAIGTTAVVGVGTSFTTEFSVGDWITFTGDVRSYKVLSITDTLNMTLSEAHVAGVSAVAISRGVISAGNGIFVDNGLQPSGATVDYDSTGRLFWINTGRTAVHMFDPTLGTTSNITTTQMGTQTSISNNQLVSVSVHRIPTPQGEATHALHDRIWVGLYSQGAISLDTAFDGTHIRYHWSNTDSYPVSGDLSGSASTQSECGFLLDEETGAMIVNFGVGSGLYSVDLSASNIGLLNFLGAYPTTDDKKRASTGMSGISKGGRYFLRSATLQTNVSVHYNSLCSPLWKSFRWDGSAWVLASIDEISTNIAFATVPTVSFPMALNAGVKRVHQSSELIGMGVSVSFSNVNEQVKIQSEQFVVDETQTFTCYVGAGKDNTQDATWKTEAYSSATTLRTDTELVKSPKNMWTVDGGVDGGFSLAVAEPTNPAFDRGYAEYSDKEAVGAVPYPDNSVSKSLGAVPNHLMARLRIRDMGEFSADGSVTLGGTNFTTAGAYVFTLADVGKSIFVEGVNGAAVDIDNGQAVITAFIDANNVTVDKTFSAAHTAMRWKLRDVPVVGKIAMVYSNVKTTTLGFHVNHKLFSSSDFGQNWGLVKSRDAASIQAVETDPALYSDNGVFLDSGSFNKILPKINSSYSTARSCTVFFDLSDLPENARRRQTWRVSQAMSTTTSTFKVSSIVLWDKFDNLLGTTADNVLADANSPDFSGGEVGSWFEVPYESVGTGTATTKTLMTASGDNFYEDSGIGNGALTSDPVFQCVAANFSIDDIGKYIRADNTFYLITGVQSATTVDLATVAPDISNIDWALLAFAPSDLVRFKGSVFSISGGTEINGDYYPIIDVPSATTIIVSKEMDSAVISALSFDINRTLPDPAVINSGIQGSAQLPLSQFYASSSPMVGALAYSDALEFQILASGVGATTGTDTDGDGYVVDLTIPSNLNANVAENDIAIGDYIEVFEAVYGRRVLEISSIIRGASSILTMVYDELPPSSTFTWKILRRKVNKIAARNIVIVSKVASI